MSSQRGNDKRTRPQKHKNTHVFKNDMHDKSNKIKLIKSLETWGLCATCKDVIDWKIKYKKYKPLSQAKTCIKCSQKTVKRAYYTVCQPCSETLEICGKCAKKRGVIQKIGPTPEEEMSHDSQLEQELKFMSERQRRSYYRNKAPKKKAAAGDQDNSGDSEEEESSEDENTCDEDAKEGTSQSTAVVSDRENPSSLSKHVTWTEGEICDKVAQSCVLNQETKDPE